MEANQSLVPTRTSVLNPSVAILEKDLVLLRSADKETQQAFIEQSRFVLVGLLIAGLMKEAKYLRTQPVQAVGTKERQQLMEARQQVVDQYFSLFRDQDRKIVSSSVIDVLAS